MEDDNKKTSEDRTLEFRYLKSSIFRVVHADGAYGGLTPRADIHMVLYSERPAIPDATIHEVTSEGTLGRELRTEGRGGVVREAEVDIVMSYATAKALLKWLSDKVEQLDSILAEATETSEGAAKQ